MPGTLHVVGTPIGNLGDLGERARAVLGAVDLVACEDTRRTATLLRHIGVSVPMRPLFVGNEAEATTTILGELRAGRSVALVSDAGMPGLADPGYPLLRACIDAEIDVRVVPGPSAITAALVLSGFPMERFAFEGFLPRAGAARRERLAALAGERRTTVLFESPRRLVALLDDLAAAGADRRVAVGRELTKIHEEVLRGTASALAGRLRGTTVKGEVVVVLEGAPAATRDRETVLADARARVAAGARKREAAVEASRGSEVPSAEVYAALVADRPVS